jgi:serine/threonine protein phosphatase PrpC
MDTTRGTTGKPFEVIQRSPKAFIPTPLPSLTEQDFPPLSHLKQKVIEENIISEVVKPSFVEVVKTPVVETVSELVEENIISEVVKTPVVDTVSELIEQNVISEVVKTPVVDTVSELVEENIISEVVKTPVVDTVSELVEQNVISEVVKPIGSVIKIGHCIKQGRANEDRCTTVSIGDMTYLAVFDGHGGSVRNPENIWKDHPVLYLKENLHLLLEKKIGDIKAISDNEICRAITEVCVEVDQHFMDNDTSYGSCATIVLITEKKIFQANIGDCRSVIFTGDTIVSETEDCTPDREFFRIVAAGGTVSSYGCPRVNGILAVSRAFGDLNEKKIEGFYSPEGPVSVIPEITITPRTSGQYIVMGSDGLYDGFKKDSQAVVTAINCLLSSSVSLDEICETVIDIARPMTSDDITMILASL